MLIRSRPVISVVSMSTIVMSAAFRNVARRLLVRVRRLDVLDVATSSALSSPPSALDVREAGSDPGCAEDDERTASATSLLMVSTHVSATAADSNTSVCDSA